MPRSRTTPLILPLLGLAAVGLAAARPVAAQDLTYTFSGVVFNDRATASGFVDFNPTTQLFGAYDITTTDGVSDGLTGTHYLSSSPQGLAQNFNDAVFVFTTRPLDPNLLVVNTSTSIYGPGTYAITTGTLTHPGFQNSGEFAPLDVGSRVVKAGKLVVTPVAVPEPSSSVSLGLLCLCLGGVVVVRRRKKA